jgi:hypothetical protein
MGKSGRTGARTDGDRNAPISVTEDLLARFAGSGQWQPGTPQESMVVTYVRAYDLDERDPREFVLRPAAVWTLTPDQTFGFGRAPLKVNIPVDVGVNLVEDGGRLDSTLPRLAGRLEFQQGLWRLTVHATTQATLTVSAPGMSVQVSNRSPALAIRSRRLTVTVHARSRGDEGGDLVHHRFTLLSPRIPDDLPTVMSDADATGSATSEFVSRPTWTWDQQRLLAAWAYPELIGLPTWGFRRGLLTRRLLRQALTGDDPNERVLATLRRNAGKATGVSMTGETGTPLLLSYLVSRRGFLGQALADLHAAFDAQFPPTDPPERR